MLARCARCQNTFTTETYGLQRCPHCGRIYWPATHRSHMLDELAALGLAAAGGEAG